MTNEHKRRPHYSGKYPKHFNEKYKELNPEKYMSQQEHVINKGITPAGTHIPIMVDEILRFLQIKEGEKGIDCTLGYGGHTTKMLEKLDHTGHLVSLDIDPEKLYMNMVQCKADWLYELPQWDNIFSAEKRKALYLTEKKSHTVVKEKKIGRNDPCPCGSGKKYKQCCGKNA